MGLNANEEQLLTNLAVSAGAGFIKKLLTKGANPPPAPIVRTNIWLSSGLKTDTAGIQPVRITVPPDYLTKEFNSQTPNLAKGILFPYTPSITLEHKATYAAQNPTHSNFTQHFYQYSSITPITITGKFTVENQTDAAIYLMTTHLLKSLTKMRWGSDSNSGAPPPVCRLFAYGSYMLDNVPVVITSFKQEFPDNVDYFSITKLNVKDENNSDIYKRNSVPVSSTLVVTCVPMYSRSEIQKFGVDNWLNGTFNTDNGNGYL